MQRGNRTWGRIGMRKRKRRPAKTRYRYGIGEWYGKSFVRLTPRERRRFAEIQALDKKERPFLLCPFRSTPNSKVPCTKEGGVCSIRMYQQDASTNLVSLASGQKASLVTTCPYRFQQEGVIFKWIGDTLLGDSNPHIVREIGFLEQEVGEGKEDRDSSQGEDVGRIDNVLVHSTREPMHWCALEIQAVYFSGASMKKEFKMLRRFSEKTLTFPAGQRRPDYRSSGPKRLMPQLQIKVPSLRRWGKRMAVVVDRNFFSALGKMDDVKDVSNCDIAWFVVKYDESSGEAVLTPGFVRLTTLERAVEGLTGGHPVSLEVFEGRIREKVAGE